MNLDSAAGSNGGGGKHWSSNGVTINQENSNNHSNNISDNDGSGSSSGTTAASSLLQQQQQGQQQAQQPPQQQQKQRRQRVAGWPTKLHKLIGENETNEWTSVLEHINNHPEDVSKSGKAFRMLPLHMLGYKQPNVNVISALINAKPGLSCIQNVDGETPVHVAFSGLCDEDVISLLIKDGGSLAITLKDKYDDTPLLVAAGSGCSLQILKQMLCTFLKEEKDSKGKQDNDRLPHVLIHESNENNVTAFSSLGRSYVDVTSPEQLMCNDDEDENFYVAEDWKKALLFLYHSALHAKIIPYEQMPLWTVEPKKSNKRDLDDDDDGEDDSDNTKMSSSLTLNASTQHNQPQDIHLEEKGDDYRSSNKDVDSNTTYCNPLHLACRMNAPFVLIQTMCRLFPEWCVQLDIHGYTPLHYAAVAPIWIDVAPPVLEDEYMDTMIEDDDLPNNDEGDNSTSQSQLQQQPQNASDHSINAASATNSGASMSVDGSESFNDGWSDLDDDADEEEGKNEQKLTLPKITPTVVDILVTKGVRDSPSIADNNNGRLPLSMALECGKLLDDGPRSMILSCPRVLDTIDIKTNMYPFMIAASTTYNNNNHKNVDKSSTTNQGKEERYPSKNMFIDSPFVRNTTVVPSDGGDEGAAASANDILTLGTVYELIRSLPELIAMGLQNV